MKRLDIDSRRTNCHPRDTCDSRQWHQRETLAVMRSRAPSNTSDSLMLPFPFGESSDKVI